MNRFLKVVYSLALVLFFAACKDDDSANIAPPRDYGLQYATEKTAIEEYLQSHYIVSVDADYNIDIQEIDPDAEVPQVSIWDQTVYPLQSRTVTSNGVDYTLYYLVLREGINESPTVYDQVRVAYRGFLLNGTQFDYDPFPQTNLSLLNTIEAWREILPLFKSGNYVDIPGDPNPASYEDYGAGVMFVPSGLAYYNAVLPNAPSYSTMVFSFKLYDVDWVDHDQDGIYTRFETIDGVDPADYDTDGDGTPNFLDVDDDNDTFLTKAEIRIPGSNPAEYYPFEEITDCSGGLTGTKRHLDPACH